jgi:fucose permease
MRFEMPEANPAGAAAGARTAAAASSSASRERRLTWLAYAAMVVLGVNVGWLGPFLAQISGAIHASLDRTGLILSAIAAGYFVALPAGGELGHRRGPHFLLVLAIALDALGFFGLALATSLRWSLIAAAAIGFGQCGIDVAANALVAELNRGRLTPALNYLHAMFGVGATLGPAIDGFALANHIGYRATFAYGAAATAAVAAAVAIAPRVEHHTSPGETLNLRALLAHPLIWTLALVLCLYVGAEVGVGAWLFSYLRIGAAPFAASAASVAVSVYWAGLIAGRLLGGRLAHHIPARRLAALGSAISTLSLIALIASPSVPLSVFPLVALIGFGYGPVFPSMIAIGAERFPSRVASMTSVVAGGAAIGGVLLPWAMGLALVSSGRGASIGLALAATIVMLAVIGVLDRVARPSFSSLRSEF